MIEDFNRIIVVDSDADIYENVDDYFNSKGLDRFSQHRKCYKTLIKDIGFDQCKLILFEYVYMSELILDYKQDKNFNFSKLQRQLALGYFPVEYAGVRPTKWDEIGHRMLRANRKLYIKEFSFCNLTCLAKECARIIVEKYKRGQLK